MPFAPPVPPGAAEEGTIVGSDMAMVALKSRSEKGGVQLIEGSVACTSSSSRVDMKICIAMDLGNSSQRPDFDSGAMPRALKSRLRIPRGIATRNSEFIQFSLGWA